MATPAPPREPPAEDIHAAIYAAVYADTSVAINAPDENGHVPFILPSDSSTARSPPSSASDPKPRAAPGCGFRRG